VGYFAAKCALGQLGHGLASIFDYLPWPAIAADSKSCWPFDTQASSKTVVDSHSADRDERIRRNTNTVFLRASYLLPLPLPEQVLQGKNFRLDAVLRAVRDAQNGESGTAPKRPASQYF
jgi:hypothetical protein